jgi:uncharacterized membrane protein/membrane-bound inhibitor of C-type lysozyme
MSMQRSTALVLAALGVVAVAQLALRGRAPSRDAPAAVGVAPAPVAPVAPKAAREAELAGPPPAQSSASESRPPAAAPTAAAGSPGNERRFVFDCGNGVVFDVRTAHGEATLSSPQALGAERITLPQVPAASGARYAEGGVSYSNSGGLATFELRDRVFADCTSNPGAAPTAASLRRGVAFRARGNQPSWQLEISHERIELVTEAADGTSRLDFPYREPTVAGARTTYRSFVGTQELLVVIDRAPCNDTASGEAFESAVTVTFDNATRYGCGQPP